ncbi:MAG TPA: type II toxin-antitoxin system RelE/ParE family toxin [Spirochaetota bacterium]|nr:type II toxin-antitoxin system RelE/ParE family toxin [Spirochaetota bacterium]
MNLEIKKTFEKDIASISDKKLLTSITGLIDLIEKSGSLREIKNLKKIEGHDKHYRIRIGDYRIGLFVEEKTVFLVRFLHRRDVYRYFP